MKQRKSTFPLFWKLTFWITLSVFVLLTVALGFSLRYSLETGQQKIDDMLHSTLDILADTPMVKRLVRERELDAYLSAFLRDMAMNTEDLDYIVIADKDSIVLYHEDPQYIGQLFGGTDQNRALAGEHYLTDYESKEHGNMRTAFHPIFNLEGQIEGFVMAASTHQRLERIRSTIYQTFWQLYLVLGIATLVFSALLAFYLSRQLRGVRPEDLLRVYLTQNDILNALDEGLVSYDTTGRIRLANAAAARMLGCREDLLQGQEVDELILSEDGESLRERKFENSHSIRSNRANILVRPIKLPNANLWARKVLILTDRTETLRYAEELVGNQHMISALRATSHEFLNKLQVISGLLHMGQISQAQEYIGQQSAVHEHILGPVMRLIRNPNVAALILGKENNMREMDIRLSLVRNSRLPEQSRFLDTSDLVTVVGNLLENAMEAVNAAPPGGMRAVSLQITEDDNGLFVMVSDTGVGILESNLPRIFEYGFSTKARSGRGIGMKLIADIVERCEGSIDVETEPGSGTTISVIFSRERGELT